MTRRQVALLLSAVLASLLAVGARWPDTGGSSAGSLNASIVKIAEDYAGADFSDQVEAAQDASPVGGTILITADHTLTGTTNLDQPDTRVLCSPGVVLTKGADVRMFDVTAPRVTIENCEMDGNKAAAFGITVNVYVQHGADDLRLINNRIRDSNGPNIEMTGVGGLLRGVVFRGNSITGANKTEIVIIRNVADILIDGNEIFHDSTTRLANTQGLIVHTQNIADTARNILVVNNRMKIGGVAVSGGTCMESGAFGGGDIYNLVFSNNSCEAVGSHADMVSFANQSYVVVSNNIYKANGNPSGLPVIELAEVAGFTVTGNLLNLEGVSAGLSVDGGSNGTISGNLFNLFGSDSGEHYAIKFFNGGANAQNVAITGNTFIFPTPVSAINDFAVAIQSSAANTISDMVVSGNVFAGKGNGIGGAGSVGVRFEENAGTVTRAAIDGNTFYNMNQGVLVGSNVSNITVGTNFYELVITRVNGTSSGSTGIFVIERGGDPFPGAACADGSLWVDTDTASDTDCTTTTNGAICRCISGAWVSLGE